MLEYQCPGCRRWFDHSVLDELQADHIWPYSLFGETSWDNYRLLCARCNRKKSNLLDTEVRVALGNKAFREQITIFLREALPHRNTEHDVFLRDLTNG